MKVYQDKDGWLVFNGEGAEVQLTQPQGIRTDRVRIMHFTFVPAQGSPEAVVVDGVKEKPDFEFMSGPRDPIL